MKLLGLGLVFFAVWLGWYMVTRRLETGKWPVLTDRGEQDAVWKIMKKHGKKAAAETETAWFKFRHTMAELREKIGREPRSSEKLIAEAQQETGKPAKEEPSQPGPTTSEKENRPPRAKTNYAEARRLFQAGLELYKRSDPGQAQSVVQPLLHKAAVKFEQADLKLEQAFKRGEISEARYDSFGRRVNEFLYSCRKRMELTR